MSLRPSDSVINTHKQVIDKLGLLTQDAKFFLETLDPQQKNKFQILVTAEPSPKPITISDRVVQTAKSVLDSKVFQFFVQNLDIPLDGIDYARYDNLQTVQDVTYADEVSMTFIEDELCIVRMFLQNWLELTMQQNINKGGYTFNDNQYLGRKKAIIMPMGRGMTPSTVWLEIRGMRIKNIDNFSFDQQTPEPMMIPVTFACDGVYLRSLI